MLKNSFDPAKPYRFVRYGRMSTDRQNPRSPEQQFTTITETLRRLGYPWQHLRDYRDDGISGRYLRKRDGYQAMLADIKSGRMAVDLTLVDTIERFARTEDLPEIRRDLHLRYGVLVLTADSNLVDPTSVSGKALGFVESFRSTEENRLKAHNVLRGKRDLVRQGKWPGGPAPFGYRLKSFFKEVNGRQEVDYSGLVPDPMTAWIVRLLFAKANESGWGSSRLAKFLNDHPDIGEGFKPFAGSNIGDWLKQKLYKGTLEWEAVNTGVVNDRRVYEPNAEEDRTIYEGFCEPLVSADDWAQVQALREQRKGNRASSRVHRAIDDKLLRPVARGLVMQYPLTGLVRCGICGRAMNPASSKAYVTKNGEKRRYTGYVCPVVSSGVCHNRLRVPEDWLRKTVIQTLLADLRLLPDSTGEQPVDSELLNNVTALVEALLRQLVADRPTQAAALQAEAADLERQIQGWTQSLGRPELPEAVRSDIEQRYAEARQRQAEIRCDLADEDVRAQQRTLTVDSTRVKSSLQRLHETLLGDNATMANFQLALHIDSIRCDSERGVVLRICKLGILPDIAELVARFRSLQAPATDRAGHSRRRGRLALAFDDATIEDGDAEYFALAPERFGGLPEEFFCERVFQVPKKLSWAEQHAEDVYQRRQSGLTFKQLAAQFGKSVPTLRNALKIAERRRQS